MHSFGLKPKLVEKKSAVRYEASWDHNLEIRICEDKEEAIAMLEQDDAEIKAFGDGSG